MIKKLSLGLRTSKILVIELNDDNNVSSGLIWSYP